MNYCEGGKVEKASKREDLQEMLKIDNKGSLLYKVSSDCVCARACAFSPM